VSIYLDGKQLAEREPAKVFHDLAEAPGVEKHKPSYRGLCRMAGAEPHAGEPSSPL
jgi:hypothetical protein